LAKELEKPMHFNEVKEHLGMGTDFVYKELQEGRLKGSKLGNRWIVYPSDLAKYLKNRPSNQKKIS
jgi:excisionase family DNA binding protein